MRQTPQGSCRLNEVYQFRASASDPPRSWSSGPGRPEGSLPQGSNDPEVSLSTKPGLMREEGAGRPAPPPTLSLER